MVFQLAYYSGFPYELSSLPKQVIKACKKWEDQLRNKEIHPGRSSPPKIKKIKKYKNLWRVRVADDYRLVYEIDLDSQSVIMVMVDHRERVYKRLGLASSGDAVVPVLNEDCNVLEKEQIVEEVACEESGNGNIIMSEDNQASDQLLPSKLSVDILEKLKIPKKYHSILTNISTADELLSAYKVPDNIRYLVANYFWPRTIEGVKQTPVRFASDFTELESVAEGKRNLESFLLSLDDEQSEYVNRFKKDDRPTGPWLLKGAPGSGKSTVAIYCIHALMNNMHQLNLIENDRPLKILYTTYTKSLIKTSKYLIGCLGIAASEHKLIVNNVDSMAYSVLPEEYSRLSACADEQAESIITDAINACRKEKKRFSFFNSDRKFLFEEIDWVIIGQGIEQEADYLELDRSGRGRALGNNQRQDLWSLYEKFLELLRERGQCLYSERLKFASKNVQPSYDYVFIDEAQDLKPVAIQFLMGLCLNRKNIFLSADVNQSIWGSSFSWNKMASDLRIQGRAKILKKNFRNTKEIWNAVKRIAPRNDYTDEETLNVEAFYNGKRPVLVKYSSELDVPGKLNALISESLLEEKVTPSSVAILCPKIKIRNAVFEIVDKKFKPKVMNPRDVNMSWPGAKIMTMHAAKGLEFPIVILFSLGKGNLPWPVIAGVDEDQHNAQQQRLLFVACSRALRRLIVFASRENPSSFIELFEEEAWEIMEL